MNKKSKLFSITGCCLLASLAAFILIATLAYGDTNSPPPIPKVAVAAPAPVVEAVPLPAPPPATAQAAPAPPPNPINLQTAIWIDDAMTRLHALQDQQSGTWASKIRILAAKYPTASLLILLRGFLGLFGLPIHTLLQGFLKRRGISPEKVSADTSAVFKQFDWIVNLITSVKPSLVSAAASLTKVSIQPPAVATVAPKPPATGS